MSKKTAEELVKDIAANVERSREKMKKALSFSNAQIDRLGIVGWKLANEYKELMVDRASEYASTGIDTEEARRFYQMFDLWDLMEIRSHLTEDDWENENTIALMLTEAACSSVTVYNANKWGTEGLIELAGSAPCDWAITWPRKENGVRQYPYLLCKELVKVVHEVMREAKGESGKLKEWDQIQFDCSDEPHYFAICLNIKEREWVECSAC